MLHLLCSIRPTGSAGPARLAGLARLARCAPIALAALAIACSSDTTPKSSGDAGDASTGAADTSGDTSGGGGNLPAEIVVCDGTPAPATDPGDDVCAVVKGTAAGMLIVGDVLTPGRVYEGGAVLVDGAGMIACVGCDCAASAADVTRVLCPNGVVSPGLIDAHNHVGWLNDKPWTAIGAGVDPKIRWEHRHDWRIGKRGNPKVKTGGGGAKTNEKTWGELRYILTGGTAMFGSGDLGGLLRDLDATGSGKNGLGQPGAYYDTFPLGDSNGTQLSIGCKYPNIRDTIGGSYDAYGPHVAEGIDAEARNEFLCLTGQGDGAKDSLDGRAALIHGVGLTAPDIAFAASKGMKLIWSPRSNVSLYGDTALVTVYDRLGVSIGIGTDWVPSGSMNMLRELACADYLNQNHYGGYFSDEALWRMATLGSARALALDDATGVLMAGRFADIAIYDRGTHAAYRAVLAAGPQDVALVVRGGEAVAGNAAVVDALVSDCDDIGDVCGKTKRVCLKRDTGLSWTELKAAIGEPAYPAFFCGVPADEPNCVPERTLENDSINASTLYPDQTLVDDQDGDGIATSKDNCPTIFNPIRPLDGGKQADIDGDGLGDACDPCPLDADTTSCTIFDGDDPDGDGHKSFTDNCPALANEDQADKDKDGKGDICDPCPDHANPGAEGCLATIPAIKTDTALQGKRVAVVGVVVTTVAGNGIFIQQAGDPAVEDGGIFVYLGAAPKPATGAIVDITGAAVGIFFDQVQLTDATWSDTGATATVVALTLTANDVEAAVKAGAVSPWEGSLVRVEGVEVTDADPEGGGGDVDNLNEFVVTGDLRVDDGVWPAETPFIDPPPAKGDVFAALTGPLSWRNGFLKLLPRVPGDIVLPPPDVKAFSAPLAWQRLGKEGATLAPPLSIVLGHAITEPLQVEVSSDDPDVATVVGSPFTVEVGAKAAVVIVHGKAAGTTTLRAKLVGGTAEVDTKLVVLTDDAMPDVATIDPVDAAVVANASADFTVTLSHPAPVAGLSLAVTVVNGDSVSLGAVADGPTFAADALSASFTFVAGAEATSGKLTVGLVSEVSATITVVDAASLSQDVSGWKIVQTASDRTFVIPDGTLLNGGDYLVIGRGADKAAFEAFWQVTLPANAIYLQSGEVGSEFPSLNGDETFTLNDVAGTKVDGPSIPMTKTGDRDYQRLVPVGAADLEASWKKAPADPGKGPTPGSGQPAGATANGVYISEVSEAFGTGNYIHEFIELHFDGPKP